MTKDDIIPSRTDVLSMARDQGLPETEITGIFIVNQDDLGRFAEFVRKDYSFTHAQTWLKRFDDAIKTAVESEREACANLRQEVELRGKWPTEYEDGFWDGLEKYEELIRARGNT